MHLSSSCLTDQIRVGLLFGILLLAATSPTGAQNLDFSLPGLDQQPVRLADFRGRWVIVNFWATWCTPCLLEMPELQAFHEQYHNRAMVIGVNYQDLAASDIRAFTERLAIHFPIALSHGNPLSGFPLKGLPTTFLISPTGKLVDTHLGTVNAAMLAERLAELEKMGEPKR
jgi:thiol-disulfide isomerase/thioredoxin